MYWYFLIPGTGTFVLISLIAIFGEEGLEAKMNSGLKTLMKFPLRQKLRDILFHETEVAIDQWKMAILGHETLVDGITGKHTIQPLSHHRYGNAGGHYSS